jgi:chromosome segregation ATPase
MEREIAERERAVAQKEEELTELRKRVEAHPKEMEAAVGKAVKDALQSAQTEARNKEELLRKEFTGERNVLTTRIESLEATVKEQNEQIAKLSQQLEKAYAQIQEIALKTIEGASASKSLESLQQFISESRKQSQEK